jgi:hypothetical protein
MSITIVTHHSKKDFIQSYQAKQRVSIVIRNIELILISKAKRL